MPHTSPERVPIPGSERSPLPLARVIAPLDAAEVISVSVYVRPQQSVEPYLRTDGPALSGEEFTERFGASREDLERVEAFAKSQGLTVQESDARSGRVLLSSSVENLNGAFGVELVHYETPEVSHRGHEGPITVPAELAEVVEGIYGLDDRPVLRSNSQRTRADAAQGYSPSAIAQAYQFPVLNQGMYTTIALLEFGGGYLPSDVQSFFSAMRDPVTPLPEITDVSVDGAVNAPGTNEDYDFEVTMNIEIAGALAPNSDFFVIFAPNTDQGTLDAIAKAVQVGATIISMSWGHAEGFKLPQRLAQTAIDAAAARARAQGIVMFAATGNAGSSDGALDNLAHAQFPASSPNVIACGGTTMAQDGNGSITSEVVWNNTDVKNLGATGGGISDLYGLPDYQAGAGVPPSANPPGRVGRGIPDVAGEADNRMGYSIFFRGEGNFIAGGTSTVPPLWAALIARVISESTLSHDLYAYPINYPKALYAAPAAFHDIVQGTNGAYSARPGWDACTGLGSPCGVLVRDAIRNRLSGQLWQTAATQAGWQPNYDPLPATPGGFNYVSTANVDGFQNVVALANGAMSISSRDATGTWSPFTLVKTLTRSDPGPFGNVACAAVPNGGVDELHIVGTHAGNVWHTIRHANGSWDPFTSADITGVANPPPFSEVACAGGATGLHVVGLQNGRLWHAIRGLDGSWTRSGAIDRLVTNTPLAGAVACSHLSTANDDLHVVCLSEGAMFHVARADGGGWGSNWDDVEAKVGWGPSQPFFSKVACCGANGYLQIVGLGGQIDPRWGGFGQMWHTNLSAAGVWATGFGSVESQEGNNPGRFSAVAAGGYGTAFEIVSVAVPTPPT